MKTLHEFATAYHEFLLKQRARVVYRTAQHLAYGEKLWLLVFNHAAVGIDTGLAVGESVKGIDGLVA